MAVSITSNEPTIATVGVPEQFQVCTTTDGHAGEIVTVKIILNNPQQANNFVLYYLPPVGPPEQITFNSSGIATFGPSTGFPLANACSNFQITYNSAGAYPYTLQLISVSSGTTLATFSSTVFAFQVPVYFGH